MSSAISENADEDDLFSKASEAADELYKIRERFYPANPDEKASILESKSDLALQLLDAIPHERRKLPIQRATYEYLRGKILDVFPDYRKEAEEHLSKAVKLNPSLVDAWLCLGNCIWKKRDFSSVKNCFVFGLSKGPNKRILCQLSMLEREMAQGAEDVAEIVEESVKHAKEAITLDVKDGYSWYNLGNAYYTSFFVTGAWDHRKLLQSLKAYQNSERDERMKCYPDLYFNFATLNKYLENYEKALTGFEAAALKDPGLNATEEVQQVLYLLDKLHSLLTGRSKSKRLSSMALSLNNVNGNPSYRKTTIDFLSRGLNKGVVLIGKVLFSVKPGTLTPPYYVLCDSTQACYVLPAYGVQNEAIKEGDTITLFQPHCHHVDFSWKGKHYQFKSVRADFSEQVLVNGKALSSRHGVGSSFYLQYKPF
ncbi:unnamed protein product [Cuscuta campestris]|uniref:Tetratricopeptide repeat protein 5 OB fold domain-containing protein n=1 Tax=Cuscuta campestris TaxID=132261 RepID=A0A484KLS1_9ASTE|nr:unnamed protein product [Cuscuta campestris]